MIRFVEPENFRCWLTSEVPAMSGARPVYPQEPTFERQRPLSHQFRLLHPRERTLRMAVPLVRS
jgi:hypothetical protein